MDPAIRDAHQKKPLGVGPSIEDQVRKAYYTPSPVAYDLPQPELRNGKISEARLPNSLDYDAIRKGFVPGPGSYETPDLGDYALPEGGRLNRKPPPQNKVTLDEYPKPPPGTYGESGIPHDPTVPRQLYGSFGKDPRVSKFIEDQVKLSSGVPFGVHEVMESMENVRPFCPEGGRYMDQISRDGTGYFDHAAKITEANPEPGQYALPGAIKPNKSKGKLIWKYQSETLAKTKQIITKVVGNPTENPAPGHYTLPDCPPMTVPVTMKGRDVAPAMPHPYAYNCAPDHARRFGPDSYVPVRDQNSGDSIYGRPTSKGSVTRPGKAKIIADEVASHNMPVSMAERAIEQPTEHVQWRSGGFGSLKKVKSAPMLVKKPEHPGMEHAYEQYPALSKAHGRHDKTFLPNASRRPEIVKTHSKSSEYATLQRKKWELGKIYSAIMATAATTPEVLDEEKLRDEAARGLIDKAKFKMRIEGLSAEQQELVLAELPGVLAESGSASGSPAHSGYNSIEVSVRGHNEPFAEPPVVSAY